MKKTLRTAVRLAVAAMVVLLAIGLCAPYVTADRYGRQLQVSLERALGRRVELGNVRQELCSSAAFARYGGGQSAT